MQGRTTAGYKQNPFVQPSNRTGSDLFHAVPEAVMVGIELIGFALTTSYILNTARIFWTYFRCTMQTRFNTKWHDKMFAIQWRYATKTCCQELGIQASSTNPKSSWARFETSSWNMQHDRFEHPPNYRKIWLPDFEQSVAYFKMTGRIVDPTESLFFLLIIITVLKFHKISTIKGCICGSLGWNCKVPPNKLTAACSTEMVTTPEFPTNVAMPIKLKVTYRLGKICTLLGTNTSIHIPSKPSLLSRWFSFSQGGIY